MLYEPNHGQVSDANLSTPSQHTGRASGVLPFVNEPLKSRSKRTMTLRKPLSKPLGKLLSKPPTCEPGRAAASRAPHAAAAAGSHLRNDSDCAKPCSPHRYSSGCGRLPADVRAQHPIGSPIDPHAWACPSRLCSSTGALLAGPSRILLRWKEPAEPFCGLTNGWDHA